MHSAVCPGRTITVFFILLMLSSCSTNAGRGAVEGGATGAISGAVGGVVTTLIFGGDVLEGAARGAAWGGAVGATAGAVTGSQQDKQVQQIEAQQLARLREEIGTDALEGLGSLAECDYTTALQQARRSQQLEKNDYVLAGLWLEILTYADQRDETKARSLYPELMRLDNKTTDKDQAEAKMRYGLNSLMDIRERYRLPRICAG